MNYVYIYIICICILRYQEILHLKFEKVETELWHKDVMMYAVYDNHNIPNGQKGENIGL